MSDIGEVIVNSLARVLERLIDVNRHSSTSQLITKFQCSYAPEVSILSYLERIRKYARCSSECFVVALIYIDRIIESRRIILTSLNIHRLLITSVMLSAKFLDDIFYNNAFYAKLGGVSPLEMNALEIEFLKLINFSLFVNFDSYTQYKIELFRFSESSPKSISNPLPLYIPIHDPIYYGIIPVTIPSTKSPVSITGVTTVIGLPEMEGYSTFPFSDNEFVKLNSGMYQQQLSRMNTLCVNQNVHNHNGNYSSNGGLVLSQPNYSQSLSFLNPCDNQDNYSLNSSIYQQHSIEQRNKFSNHMEKESFYPLKYTNYGLKMEVDQRNSMNLAILGDHDQYHSSIYRSAHPLFNSSM